MSESANPTLPWPCRRGRPRRACCPLAMWPSDRRCWRPSRSWTAPSPRLKCQMRKDWDWFHCKSRYEQNIYTHCVPLIWSSDIWYEYFRIYSQFLAGPERNRLSYNKCFGNPDIWLPIRLLCRVFCWEWFSEENSKWQAEKGHDHDNQRLGFVDFTLLVPLSDQFYLGWWELSRNVRSVGQGWGD